MSKSKSSKFHMDSGGGGSPGVMGTLSETLPDERPITALHVVENSGRCPAGFWPVLKTYDEDSDADLWRQPILFGKRTCRYLCISKSEGISGRCVFALRVVASSEPPPAGYSGLPKTADSGAQAWRRRQLCYQLAPQRGGAAPAPGPLTDIILCSKLKKAPQGFQYAGEINGVMVCFKVGGCSADSSPVHLPAPGCGLILTSPLRDAGSNGGGDVNYENVAINGHTPDINKKVSRAPPERPPKTAALVAELNRLNLQDSKKSPSSGKKHPKIPESPSNHDYEALNTSYNLQPSRPAPPAPRGSAPAPMPPASQSNNTHTLGGWCGVEGVPFVLNSKLGGFLGHHISQYPIIKRKNMFQLDQEYSYNFRIERQN